MHLDFSNLRIAVIGDLIVDRYLQGAVHRVSSEAPVPVVLRQGERTVLGGAANVAANLASLRARVEIAGLVGDDEGGDLIGRLLGAYPTVGVAGLVRDRSRPTTSKTRVMSSLHQLIRIDAESSDFVIGAAEAALIAAVERVVAWADVVLLSDYAKGACSDRVIRSVIDRASALGRTCIVDPKRQDFGIYAGATVIKPNRRELSDATRMACGTDAEAKAAAESVIAQTGSAVLLTRSEQGLSFFGVSGEVLHLPTVAKDVFDVSGAGDTVMAMAGIAFAAGMAKPEMMRLANIAAGIVVGKVGTAVVTVDELDAGINEQADRGFQKGVCVSLEDAARIREGWRRRGLRVGFTNGCYDILHPGHVTLLRRAAEACDRLIVALNTDASVKRLKGPSRPVQTENARACVIGALEAVDLVILFDEDTPADAIEALAPDLLVKGADYAKEQVVGAAGVRRNGGQVLLVPIVEGQSTTALIRRGAGLR